jgi:hypothetical protein
MYEDPRDPRLMGGAEHLNRMAVVGMDTAVAEKRDEMEPALLRSAHCAP